MKINDFNEWSKYYDQNVQEAYKKNQYPFAKYYDILAYIYKIIPPNSKILDLGLGTGVLSKKLYDKKCLIYGEDFSSEMIKIAKGKMPKSKLFVHDFSKGIDKKLKREKFDYIILTYSIHHIRNDQKVQFIKSLYENLNDGGKIIIGDVIFETYSKMHKFKKANIDIWDNNEEYIIVDEIRKSFKDLIFINFSSSSAILII